MVRAVRFELTITASKTVALTAWRYPNLIIEGTNLSFLITISLYHISTYKSMLFTDNHSLFTDIIFVSFDEFYTFKVKKEPFQMYQKGSCHIILCSRKVSYLYLSK